jgi:6-phosphogluconolactonase
MAQFSGSRIGWSSAFYASVGRWLTRYVVQADGHISVQARQELPLNVQCACFHPKQPILYIACSNGDVLSPGDKHCLVQLGVGGDAMEPLAEPVQLPYRPLHAAIDLSEGRLALAYNRPAAISCTRWI